MAEDLPEPEEYDVPVTSLWHLDERLLAYAKRCTKIQEDVMAELKRNPGDIGYWNMRAAEAQMEVIKRKRDLEFVEAEAEETARLMTSGVKVTVGQIAAKVTTNPTVKAQREYLVDAQQLLAFADRMVDSLKVKHETLQSMGARERVEWRSHGDL